MKTTSCSANLWNMPDRPLKPWKREWSDQPAKPWKRREWASVEFQLECIAGDAVDPTADAYCDIVDFMLARPHLSLTREEIGFARTILEGRQRELFNIRLIHPQLILAKTRRARWARMCIDIVHATKLSNENERFLELLKNESEGTPVRMEGLVISYGLAGPLWLCVSKNESSMYDWRSPIAEIYSASEGMEDEFYRIFCECFPDFPSTDDIINYRASMG